MEEEEKAEEQPSARQSKASRVEDDKQRAEIKQALDMNDVSQILNLLLKLCLMNAQLLRDITGCIWQVWILDSDLQTIQDTQVTGQKYGKEVRNNKEKDETPNKLAPPHIQKWLTFVESLAEEAPVKNSDLKAPLDEYIDHIFGMDEKQVEKSVPFFMTKECYKSSKAKNKTHRIAFFINLDDRKKNFGGKPLDELLQEALTLVEAEERQGAAPPGPLERVAQQMLNKHWKQRRQKDKN
jgi:hypothetical protein